MKMPEYTFDQMMEDIEKDRAAASREAYKQHALESGGRMDPREFYQYSNQATKRINELWSTYTGVPVNSAGGRNQHKCVAKLLTQTPDVALIERAVHNLASEGRFGLGTDMYYLRKLVENEISKLQAYDKRLDNTQAILDGEIDLDRQERQKYLRGLDG